MNSRDTRTTTLALIDGNQEQFRGILRDLKLSKQFTTPTGMLPFIETFGHTEAPEVQPRDAGKINVKKWIFMPGGDQEVQLELPYKDIDEGVEPLERQLRRISDPLGLKVLLGTLYFCDRNHRQDWFTFDDNVFCDLLGYRVLDRLMLSYTLSLLVRKNLRFVELPGTDPDTSKSIENIDFGISSINQNPRVMLG